MGRHRRQSRRVQSNRHHIRFVRRAILQRVMSSVLLSGAAMAFVGLVVLSTHQPATIPESNATSYHVTGRSDIHIRLVPVQSIYTYNRYTDSHWISTFSKPPVLDRERRSWSLS